MWNSEMERLDIQRNILESQRSISPSTASESGEEQGSEMALTVPLETLQRRSRTFSPASISVSSEENKDTTATSQHEIRNHGIAQTNDRSFGATFSVSGKSTLKGTPWEEALHGKCPGKQIQRSDKETEVVSFWTQFFG